MKAGVMQPYFFPYLGYWQLLAAVDRYVILDDVNFIKRGWINRNRILNGDKDEFIRITIENISQNRKINEHRLFEKEKCFETLRRTIRERYAKAPCFEETYDLINRVLSFEGDNVADFLSYQIGVVCEYLDIDTELLRSSQLKEDERFRAQGRIIDLCKKLGADEYYNAIGGVELYDREAFAKEDMQLHFVRARLSAYKQFDNEFVPGLSIIDVMMFNDKAAVKQMLDDYDLV